MEGSETIWFLGGIGYKGTEGAKLDIYWEDGLVSSRMGHLNLCRQTEWMDKGGAEGGDDKTIHTYKIVGHSWCSMVQYMYPKRSSKHLQRSWNRVCSKPKFKKSKNQVSQLCN